MSMHNIYVPEGFKLEFKIIIDWENIKDKNCPYCNEKIDIIGQNLRSYIKCDKCENNVFIIDGKLSTFKQLGKSIKEHEEQLLKKVYT